MDHGVLEVVGYGLAGGAQPAGRVCGELAERAEDGLADGRVVSLIGIERRLKLALGGIELALELGPGPPGNPAIGSRLEVG